jgi:hypothetical protein
MRKMSLLKMNKKKHNSQILSKIESILQISTWVDFDFLFILKVVFSKYIKLLRKLIWIKCHQYILLIIICSVNHFYK